MGYNEGLIWIMWCGWMEVVLMVYLWRKWWLFNHIERHKYKSIKVLCARRYKNCLGGPMREEYEHLYLYISSDMMVNPKDG
jgi:hypothetical protein